MRELTIDEMNQVSGGNVLVDAYINYVRYGNPSSVATLGNDLMASGGSVAAVGVFTPWPGDGFAGAAIFLVGSATYFCW